MFFGETVCFWKTPSRGSSFLPKWGITVVMLSDFKEMGFPWGKKGGKSHYSFTSSRKPDMSVMNCAIKNFERRK